MKKPVKKDVHKSNDTKTGKKEHASRKKSRKHDENVAETPMEHDAGNQDGSAGLSGTSAI